MRPPMMFLAKIPGFSGYYLDVRDRSIWSSSRFRFHKKYTGWKKLKPRKDGTIRLRKSVDLSIEQVKVLILSSHSPQGRESGNNVLAEADAVRGEAAMYMTGRETELSSQLLSRAERGIDRRYKRR